MDAAISILDSMIIYGGNVPAKHHSLELQRLEAMVRSVLQKDTSQVSNKQLPEAPRSNLGPEGFDTLPPADFLDGWGSWKMAIRLE
jgi:hypothetical protein